MLVENWNPETPNVAATLEFMNRSFSGGWDNNLYRWYLARFFNGRTPDRLVVTEGDTVLAGSTINYRQLRMADGSIRDIGIASGSWTLPDARGKGLFTRMMQASAERAAESGCQYFLAFVTEDNASRRALERCGASMIPSCYISSSGTSIAAAESSAEIVTCVNPSPEDLFAAVQPQARVSFFYESSESWAEQQLQRPGPVDIFRVGRHYVSIEKTADTDRLQWTSADMDDRLDIAAQLVRRAAANGRKFFMYGTGSVSKEAASEFGLVVQPGYIACLITAASESEKPAELAAEWDIQSGDRL